MKSTHPYNTIWAYLPLSRLKKAWTILYNVDMIKIKLRTSKCREHGDAMSEVT